MQLKFIYSLENEIHRVLWAKENFKAHRTYGLHVSLPDKAEELDLVGLKLQVEKEMDLDLAERAKAFFLQKWQINKAIIDKYFNKLPYAKPSCINVELTKYGVAGLYWPPNKIIIRFGDKDRTFEAIIHETTHCIIEKPVVQKYNLDYTTKEGLVVWLMKSDKDIKRLFPNLDYFEGYSKRPTKSLLKTIGWDIFSQ
jgi:hypothetical protein